MGVIVIVIHQINRGFFVTICVTTFMYKSNDILRKQTTLKTRQDITHVLANLQRQRPNGRCIASDYLERNTDILDMLLPGTDDSELALSYGAILRECIRHQVAAKYILESDDKFFKYIQDPSFDIASDAASTFRELLTRHKSTVAEFLSKSYDWFFQEYNSLLQSPNYITRRNAVKLLGAMLLDRSNTPVMVRYVCSLDNMRILMNLFRDSNKTIQVEAFHVFKVIVDRVREEMKKELKMEREEIEAK